MTEEEIRAVLDPSKFIGRCAEQVEKYLEKIKPYTEGEGIESEEINV